VLIDEAGGVIRDEARPMGPRHRYNAEQVVTRAVAEVFPPWSENRACQSLAYRGE
jgi:hypothetical protein